ncbi:hypothetical protein CPter291_2523 [Collimonas pratensis]|uniref:Uncharacterized protein n=1 Tax=Collimonas pratensis TaxID=279113 RepID=A0ABN4MB33_9BURK|nr:hypothetical protein CPter291_2523 [Collimonas pratensis]
MESGKIGHQLHIRGTCIALTSLTHFRYGFATINMYRL